MENRWRTEGNTRWYLDIFMIEKTQNNFYVYVGGLNEYVMLSGHKSLEEAKDNVYDRILDGLKYFRELHLNRCDIRDV